MKVWDYTFDSQSHQTFSHIDFFSVIQLLDQIKEFCIGIRTLSDHSPLNVIVQPHYKDPLNRQWWLQPSLLSSPQFVQYRTHQCNFIFIEVNKIHEISPSILWETAKAYLRGAIISYSSAQKTEAIKTQVELKEKIQRLERDFRSSPVELYLIN